ncbi:Beta-xylosidase [Sedimentisphaera cyanobacteriorum]|uniref:Beta-xylosidase n=1 Tax=Sedimentisphaera cyanobacteriorum TaxID=1940790 RepID=A0A1Q2HR53_9BACT|nr:glycoside hydrolase family protein [Sedimentisphaera cyanobacteriorum]AQQ09949.1 Beta-xylosidase [Sedimentisphaera cyanobacteriorum]
MFKSAAKVFPVICMCVFLAAAGAAGAEFSIEPIPAEAKENFLKSKTAKNVIANDKYYVWGLSVAKWKDGRYHAYYNRWPKSRGFGAWLHSSEIVHAVAEKPEGPFETKNVVLKSRKSSGWGLVNSSNPYVCLANGKICLYYISNDISEIKAGVEESEILSQSWLSQNGKTVRNTQRIGVAIADRPEGPFRRSEFPAVVPHGNFKNIAVNPAVIYQDGSYMMIMKGDDARREGWFRIQLIGESETPEGPFKFDQKPVFAKRQTEDACIWYDKGLEEYFMVCHVLGGNDLRCFKSSDKKNWEPNSQPVFTEKHIKLDNGKIWNPRRMERPFVLTDSQGNPVMAYFSVLYEGRSGNVAVPVTKE